MAKVIDASAVIVMLIAGVFLYVASLPIPGALTFIGAGKTPEEIERADRRRKWQSRLGLALLVVGSLVQMFRIVGVLR